jgi:hypothetical protein
MNRKSKDVTLIDFRERISFPGCCCNGRDAEAFAAVRGRMATLQ